MGLPAVWPGWAPWLSQALVPARLVHPPQRHQARRRDRRIVPPRVPQRQRKTHAVGDVEPVVAVGKVRNRPAQRIHQPDPFPVAVQGAAILARHRHRRIPRRKHRRVLGQHQVPVGTDRRRGRRQAEGKVDPLLEPHQRQVQRLRSGIIHLQKLRIRIPVRMIHHLRDPKVLRHGTDAEDDILQRAPDLGGRVVGPRLDRTTPGQNHRRRIGESPSGKPRRASRYSDLPGVRPSGESPNLICLNSRHGKPGYWCRS